MRSNCSLNKICASFILLILQSNLLWSQGNGTVYQSVSSLAFIGSEEVVILSEEEKTKIVNNFLNTLSYWNNYANEKADPGGWKGGFKKYVNPVVDIIAKVSPVTEGMAGLRDFTVGNILSDGASYKRTRDRNIRELFDYTASKIIKEHCFGNVSCVETVFTELIRSDQIIKQLKEADALGAFDESQTRAFVKASIDNSAALFQGTIGQIENLEVTTNLAIADVKNIMIAGFEEVNINQQQIIKGVSSLLYIEQKQTIALQNIQNTLNANFENINVQLNNVIKLQLENLMISNVTLEAVGIIGQNVNVLNQNIGIIDSKINDLSATINQMQVNERNEKVTEIFKNSPINIQIEALKDSSNAMFQLVMLQENGDDKRKKLIANLDALKTKQDVIIAAKMINTWGKVGKEALSVFCSDCPEELAQGINAVIITSDIIGNIVSGNPAAAILGVLGIFKKPEPSPELKMLNQISSQLRGLEANMNNQFKQVHEHLFALEENLGNRMAIVDFKINQLTQTFITAHIQVLEQLSGIDSKLSYIVNQNECTKELVLKLTQQAGQDLCKIPVGEFKKRISNRQINNFQDLDNFFRGSFCQPCIKALFDASNISLGENASFRYADCLIEGQNSKARPDRIYEFLFQNFIRENAQDSTFINSMLLIPADVRIAPTFSDSLRSASGKSVVSLNEEDRFYRNHELILAYADYIMTLFSVMEFFDNGRLLTPAEIIQNPGFSKERAQKMVVVLEDIQDLLNHGMLQQTLLAGNGVFQKLDLMLENASAALPFNSDDAVFSLLDLFKFDPYLRKNFAAHLIDQHIGLDRLKDTIKKKGLKKRGKQRIAVKGMSILLYEDEKGNPSFIISLTNPDQPEKNIDLLGGQFPVLDGVLDVESYHKNLEFAFPLAYLDLVSMKARITAKLVEMNLILSADLDAETASFSRDDLMFLIHASRE